MKIEYHPAILEIQKYSCNCCGAGCRSFLVSVNPEEREKIEALADWRKKLGIAELFVKHQAAGAAGYGLAKRADGSCVFLDGDNLCIIHKLHGLQAKPLACQLYPFVLTPVGRALRVGLRFDCPAVSESTGENLSAYRAEVTRLAQQLLGQEIKATQAPPLCPKRRVEWADLETVNETFLKIIGSNAQDLITRLHWLRGVMEHINMVKWENVPQGDFKELLAMFQGGVLAELERQPPQRRRPADEPHKLLGQVFFLLSQPTTIVTGPSESWTFKVRRRLRLNRWAKQLRRRSGKLPPIQSDWPEVDLKVLEESFGAWNVEVQQMISRYLTCRVASLGYCGPNFYGYSMTEGIQTLLLAVVTVGWLMRIAAVKAGRKHIELPNAHTAVMAIDGNLGYSSALGFGPSRMRLKYLSEHLGDFINWYGA